MASELISQALCVVKSVTGRGSPWRVRMWRSCSIGSAHQSFTARIVGTASITRSNVSNG